MKSGGLAVSLIGINIFGVLLTLYFGYSNKGGGDQNTSISGYTITGIISLVIIIIAFVGSRRSFNKNIWFILPILIINLIEIYQITKVDDLFTVR